MVTIKDVAKKADVSPSTVSRVLSDSSAISKKTKKKVRKVMEEVGYTPNLSARYLATKQTKTILLVLKTASVEMRQNPFFTDVLISVSEVCKDKGYSTIMTTSIDEHALFTEVKNYIDSRIIDGIILLYSKQDKVTQYIKEKSFPFIVVGKSLNDNYPVMYVDNDNVLASEQITQYMIGLGHKSLLFISEQGDYEVSKDRVRGFKKTCEVYDINYGVVEGTLDRVTAKKIIDTNDISSYSGIITSDSMMNLVILSVLYDKDISVPNDIQTATFNDSFLSETACPSQTVVNIFPESLGKMAATNLIELLEDKNYPLYNVVIPTKIIERNSTKIIGESI
ncbi:LacI family DNA-binding transcriptional regulator [Macrococcus caseolyticus]|uniref:substrate-binding domain-containing protein n=1 Tax=Macrococcoides caseolyticum TaxID=69966 RepID=UPI0024BC85B4|nr:LacI family DNA-binding transcriptional regulator [Macrococcus caseolyticus]MDJ1153227.1 LacI family DNA-binding transcriptional regulator [Macrococcus caseolyticus]MDJ1154897.1 LacI family DNA-binding transcriptional regulator [Macrococcus caseolyticus]